MLCRRTVTGWITLALIIAWPLALWGTDRENQEPKTPIARLEVQPARVDWLPQVDFESLTLTVAGPEDFYIQREFGPGETPSFSFLDLRDGRLPDGIYAYELRTVPRVAPELREKLAKAREGDDSAVNELRQKSGLAEEPLVQSGQLWVQRGSFVDKITIPPSSSSPTKQPEPKPPLRNVAAKTDVPDDLIVHGHACIGPECTAPVGPGLTLKENIFGLLQLKFENVGCCYPSTIDWAIQANDDTGPNAPNGDFLIRNLSYNTIPFRIFATSPPDNSLTIFSNGNIGLGTLTPAVRLDVKASASGQAAARLQNSSATGYSGTEYLDNAGNVDLFFGIDNAASTTRLNSINNNPIVILTNSTERARITSGGDVGIGTASPSQKLEIELNQDANTIGLIENTNTGASANAVWQTHSDAGFTSFITHGSGRTLTRFGQTLGGRGEILHTGGNGLVIGTLEADGIVIGTNNTNRLQIDGSTGTVTVAGNLTVNGTFSNPSSRELKEDFAPLNPNTVLKKFAELPIQEWSYKSDEQKLRHVGPTVEDFRNAFGLGTEGQYIFPMDVQGVTMAAVQGLYQLVQEKDAQIADLQRRLDTELREIKQLLLEQAGKQ